MNLILLEPDDFLDADTARLEGRRLQHVVGVHRAAVGERLRLGVVGGRMGHGTITRLEESRCELRVELNHDPPAPLPLCLVLALPRPKVVRRVLQGVAAAGIKRVHLLNAWRVEKSYWGSPQLAPASLRAQLLLGLEQGCDTILPEVTLHRLFKPFVEDDLPALAAGSLGLVAHVGAGDECPHAVAGAVTLAVGPEGGFIDYEVEALRAAGLRPVSLGPRVLRVENAVPVLLGRLF